jgi:uncharacterized repeat protein (TIGR03837 family)
MGRIYFKPLEACSKPSKNIQEYESITYINTLALDRVPIDSLGAADVAIERFACHIPEPLLEIAYERSKLISNLAYLSAEDWVEDYHLKESLLGRGTARKFFFMQGFREGTGGLILNSSLEKLRDSAGGIDRFKVINSVLSPLGITADPDNDTLIGTVFTYERGFDTLLSDLVTLERPVILLVFGDKSQRGMSSTLKRFGVGEPHQRCVYKNIQLAYTPFISQHTYDTLLCCTGFNIVRGEDSLARAVLSGKPFIWNAYIQDDRYQRVKVEALLKAMRPFYKGYEERGDNIFTAYGDLTLRFNDAPSESSAQTTTERYTDFFMNLKKHERTAVDIYYFMRTNCNLITKFFYFLNNWTDTKAGGHGSPI